MRVFVHARASARVYVCVRDKERERGRENCLEVP